MESVAGIANRRPTDSTTTGQAAPSIDSILEQRAQHAVDRAASLLRRRQDQQGYWCGELEGDTILESEYILLLESFGCAHSERARQAANYLLDQQLPSGGWTQYPGGDVDISGSVKAYFALKLTGHHPDAPCMQRARQTIREHGGADAVNSFTRFYLALLGQISYDHCPAVPPEALLLPAWCPVSIYRISAWSRTILVPLSIMWALRPTSRIEKERGISELFLRPPAEWPTLRSPGFARQDGWFSWEHLFRLLDQALKRCERARWTPFRQRALRAAERWILERFKESDGLGAIFPPIVWSTIALRCLGYDPQSAEMKYCWRQLEKLMIRDGEQLRVQPCLSPVWDTALSLRALSAAGATAEDPSVAEGVSWLLSKEVKRKGDWAIHVRSGAGGWFFEHENAFYPDVDDTIMVMMALVESAGSGLGSLEPSAAHSLPVGALRPPLERGRRWVLAMQNRDGGWGAFDRNNNYEFLCHVPFADHNAMIDPSTPDITGRVLESLGVLGIPGSNRADNRTVNRAVCRAVRFLERTQEPDGSWPGRWGINYIYGTWQVLVGLKSVGIENGHPMFERGVQWLLSCQQSCGGWGESADSYVDTSLKGVGPVTPSQTSWALLGLMAAGLHGHRSVRRGIQFLVECAQTEGGWSEPEFTGTGFPRVFYLRYHMYPLYFPIMALCAWSKNRAFNSQEV